MTNKQRKAKSRKRMAKKTIKQQQRKGTYRVKC